MAETVKFRSILVVCIGNICRSPMAEVLLRQQLSPALQVSSAGLSALVSHPADDHAIALMQADGLDLTAHRARQLNQTLINDHDLILVMTQRQKEVLEKEFPSARGRVFRLCHWQPADVADPYQQDRAAFEQALTLIRQGVTDWCAKLQPSFPA